MLPYWYNLFRGDSRWLVLNGKAWAILIGAVALPHVGGNAVSQVHRKSRRRRIKAASHPGGETEVVASEFGHFILQKARPALPPNLRQFHRNRIACHQRVILRNGIHQRQHRIRQIATAVEGTTGSAKRNIAN
jgi:hypothetical protein